MRRNIAGALVAIASTSAFATPANDYIGVISNQTRTESILVSGDELRCELYSNNRGYIPYDWSQVILKTSLYPEPIFSSPEVIRYSDASNGSAEALCNLVSQVKSQADEHGYVNAQVRIKAEIKLSPSYAGGCSRDLQEEVTVTFANGLILKALNARALAGGTVNRSRCATQF
jgi:hypothetical protein